MRRLRIALCLLVLGLLTAALPLAKHFLPQDNRALVEKKYAGFSGVLRLWVFEGWQPGAGSFTGWLNRCVAGFEKRHPGVYVQAQAVDAGAMAALNDSGIVPPDMLLFPPGLLDAPDGLLPLSVEAPLRAGLAHAGTYMGATYAVPVAMGGYLWVYDAARLDGIPGTWRGGDAMPAVAPDDAWHCRGAAMLSLCAKGYRAEAPAAEGGDLSPGIDLGLPAPAVSPTPTAAPETGDILPCALPEGFDFDADAWRRFANGEAPALLATPREIRRLQALSEQGKGPNWRLGTSAAAFTDQLLSLAIVDQPDSEARQALCAAFLEHLLSDECQGALAAAGAFAVTGGDSGYAAGDPLAQADAALRRETLCAPNSFATAWRDAAADIVREFIDGEADAAGLWRRLNATF